MKLTGKCKEDFDKWYLDTYCKGCTRIASLRLKMLVFLSLEPSKQYGVYIDFFDSVKYEGKSFFSKIFAMYYKEKTEYFTHNDIIRNSIEKANEIYNK